MTKQKLTSFDEVALKLKENPDFRKAEREIRPYFDLVVEIINQRVRLGLSQKELAEKAGTHQSRISKIESAELDVRLSTLIEIAEALECELEIRLLPIAEPEDFKRLFTSTIEIQDLSKINTNVKYER
jgi:transcriptional regulator with XRE-family HTH domain